VNDFSTVVFPADVRNCQVCHDQNSSAAQAKVFLTNPARDARGSCHDDVNFATGENHVNLPQIDDNQCANCHTPQGELEFDASILGAHTIPRLSKSLPGTVFNLVRVDNGAAGKSPALTFSVQDKSGKPVAVPSMDRLAVVLAGPTTDYAGYVSEDPRKTAVANSDGTYTYKFQAQIPPTAVGTFSIGIEGYRNQTLLPGTKKEVTVRDAGANQVISFSLDGSPVAPRRTVVAVDNCNQCHYSLSVHGDNRSQTVMCVLCHNPNTTDADMRPAS
jgi:OmcA/MtrC family decaheme c-type cytochrome